MTPPALLLARTIGLSTGLALAVSAEASRANHLVPVALQIDGQPQGSLSALKTRRGLYLPFRQLMHELGWHVLYLRYPSRSKNAHVSGRRVLASAQYPDPSGDDRRALGLWLDRGTIDWVAHPDERGTGGEWRRPIAIRVHRGTAYLRVGEFAHLLQPLYEHSDDTWDRNAVDLTYDSAQAVLSCTTHANEPSKRPVIEDHSLRGSDPSR